MRFLIRGKVLLAGAGMMAGLAAWGQAANPARPVAATVDAAVTYDAARANTVPGSNFWLQGGSAQVHAQLWRGWGAAADVAGLHAGNMHGTGVGLDMLTFTLGPRYTWTPAHRSYAIFGQTLIGETHGMNSVFPGAVKASSSASSLALYLGGGVNLRLKGRLSLRALEANWLRTQLPNATTGVQNHLRLGAGVVYRFR
jgi:hypothetical protein